MPAEWYFRSGLDRYIWIWGMVCAYLHPHATKLLNAIEELPQMRRVAVRGVILTATSAAFVVYYKTIYSLPKVEYNKVCMTMLCSVGTCALCHATACTRRLYPSPCTRYQDGVSVAPVIFGTVRAP